MIIRVFHLRIMIGKPLFITVLVGGSIYMASLIGSSKGVGVERRVSRMRNAPLW